MNADLIVDEERVLIRYDDPKKFIPFSLIL